MSLVFTSWNFDKPVYDPGDTITLTVAFTSTDLVAASDVSSAVTAVLSDAAGTLSQSSDGSAAFPGFTVAVPSGTPMPVTATVTDSRTPSGTWVLLSSTFTGTVSPFAGTAVLTSIA